MSAHLKIHDDGQLLQEVLALLALRESTAVPHWAASRLAALCRDASVRVWRVFPIGAARQRGGTGEFSVAADSAESDIAPPGIGTDPELEEAIGKRQVVRRAVPARLLIPLACGDEVRYVVELNGAAGGAGSLADALIALVGSYYEQVADAETDPLTRLANRRVLYSQVGRALARRAASSHRRFLAVIDIDHFKLVNDRFGHLYGDEILIHFARLMRSTFRAGDLLYRFGGEEFVVLYSVERHEDRQLALERFRAAVEAYPFPRVGRVTASIGFTALEGPIVPATTFVDRADNAVYYAKRQGRNRVCEYEALVASGALEVPQAEPGGEATLF